MNFVMRITLIIALAVFLAAATGCNYEKKEETKGEDKVTEEVTDEATDKATLVTMEAAIDALIGEATCGEAGDCRAIAFGAKPCGGPWKFKVYAASSLDNAKLEEMVTKYNQFNSELNEKHGWMSDCMVVMPPEVDCVDGRCVAVDNMTVKPVE